MLQGVQAPISIALPSVGIQRAGQTVTEAAQNVADETGRVVSDYIADEYINPLKTAIGTYTLIAAGLSFVLVGLLIIALTNDTSKKVVVNAAKAAV